MPRPDGVLEAARGLGPEIEAAAPETDRSRRLPASLLASLHKHRMFRMLLPKPYGGLEVPPPLFFKTISEIARHDGSTAWCLCQANGCAMAAAYLAPEVAEEMWGGDPAAVLAWGPGPAEAREAEGGYRISARIAFASGARHATWLGAHMPVVDDKGERQRMPDGSPLIRSFLMPASSIEIEDIWNTIGLRGTASDGYTLKDRFVPAAFTTVRDEADYRRYEAPLYLFLSMNMYAMGFAGTALGIAQGALDAFMALAQDKTPASTGRASRTTTSSSTRPRRPSRASARRAPSCCPRSRTSGRRRRKRAGWRSTTGSAFASLPPSPSTRRRRPPTCSTTRRAPARSSPKRSSNAVSATSIPSPSSSRAASPISAPWAPISWGIRPICLLSRLDPLRARTAPLRSKPPSAPG